MSNLPFYNYDSIEALREIIFPGDLVKIWPADCIGPYFAQVFSVRGDYVMLLPNSDAPLRVVMEVYHRSYSDTFELVWSCESGNPPRTLMEKDWGVW